MKTIVVTGGTIRVGKAIAECMRAKGWKVITTSHREDAGADVVADFSERLGAAKAYAKVLELNGGMPPEVWVNNAALFRGEDGLMRSVNVEAVKTFTTLMAGRENGRGVVINIGDAEVEKIGGSGESRVGGGGGESRFSHGEHVEHGEEQVGGGVYWETKREVVEWTRKAAEMFEDTINVNALALGPVMAPVGVHVSAGECPLGRPTLEDVARAVEFLAEAKRTSGVVLPVAGRALV